ncbi:unnamed protein product, partial [marine sediment metagenome]
MNELQILIDRYYKGSILKRIKLIASVDKGMAESKPC